MKNLAPGEIHNLHKKRLLEHFLATNPSDEEQALREKLSGKTPSQAVEIIAKDFNSQFADLREVGINIRRSLLGDGKYIQWTELDRRIQQTHRRLLFWPEATAAAYLDRLRGILFSLPNRVRHEDLPEQKMAYKKPREAARGFGTCHLCWRSVPTTPRSKAILFCHEHSYPGIPSRHPEHRRRMCIKAGDSAKGRQSIEDKVEQLKIEIHLPLMRRTKKAKERNAYYAELCLDLNGPLSYLAKYLRDRGITQPDCEMIGRGLEDDANIPYAKPNEIAEKAWQFFFTVEMNRYFFLYWEKLFSAEAWLAGDAKRRKNK